MPTLKLTKSVIDKLPVPEKEVCYWDPDLRGLGLKCLPSGRRVFIMQKDVGGRTGRTRKITIGAYGELTPQGARAIAMDLAVQLRRGYDPIHEKKKAKLGTLRAAFERYAAEYLARLRSGEEIRRTVDRQVLSRYGSRALSSINKSEMRMCIDRVRAQGKLIAANRLLAFLKRFFNWCIEHDLIEHSPVASLKLDRSVEKQRDRVLDYDEIRLLWRVLDKSNNPAFAAIQFMLVTAQRRDEVALMQWNHIDMRRRVCRPAHSQNQLQREAADEFIGKYFSFIVPDDEMDEECNLNWLLERAAAAVTRFSADMLVIDPWNEMDHFFDQRTMSLTQYVGFAIKELKRFARRYQVHVMVVAHPAKLRKQQDGKYPFPTPYDISDSAHWYNKPEQAIIVHREGNITTVRVAKSRYHTILGRPGDVRLKFNDYNNQFCGM